jgi:hypothetical protein
MAARELPAAYRLHAAHCVEIAASTADIENKLTLLNMARAWPLLAEQAEKTVRLSKKRMGFSTTDSVALFIFGASALVGTFGKRLVRIIGLAVMPFAFAGLVLSLNHYESAPGQGPITNNAPGINTNNTNNQSGGTNTLNIIGPQRLLFDATIGDQLASKLPTGKSIEIMAVGSRTDWNIADQYAQYLKAKGFAVSFSRSSEIVPPPDHKITIRDDLTTSPIVVIIAPSAL